MSRWIDGKRKSKKICIVITKQQNVLKKMSQLIHKLRKIYQH